MPDATPPGSSPYDREYYRLRLGGDDLRRFSMAWWSVRLYQKLCLREVRRLRATRVLEIGCGHGHVLAALARRCATFGLDVSDVAVERARQVSPRSRVFVADIGGALPDEVAAAPFDLVLARYVLEHVPDPGAALRRIAGLVRPGGALLFAVPDTRSRGLTLKGKDWFAYKDPTHVSLLGGERWLELAREAGFDVRRAHADGLWDPPYLPRVPRALQALYFGLPPLATVLGTRLFLPAGFGENLIVFADRRSH